ncbi:MAG: S8 family serine peptidase [Bacteroidales bacterium]|nr:S8 family serine peptidase [Bacteroidales bacterium]
MDSSYSILIYILICIFIWLKVCFLTAQIIYLTTVSPSGPGSEYQDLHIVEKSLTDKLSRSNYNGLINRWIFTINQFAIIEQFNQNQSIMKKIATIIAAILFMEGFLFSQSNFINDHILQPHNPKYVSGEVLVKFKDDVIVKPEIMIKRGVKKVSIDVKSIDEFFHQHKAIGIEKVFGSVRKSQSKGRYIVDFKGNRHRVPVLYNIFKVEFEVNQDVIVLSDLLAQDSNIEFAEPNYLFYSMATYPDDPLYQNGSQEYLNTINAPAAWDSITGDTSQVIAILDTGIDWNHPDLDENIWTNLGELPNGVDDDGNGYTDDIRGWDFINNDNDPNDDNSHGTHVAGIAGAEGNNGTGITGVLWNVKLMPVKILQSSGAGSSSDFAAGINYAANNGATVINMSLGSYAESLTIKAALENAYAGTGSGDGSILVAAAGNDNRCICSDCGLCFSMYPACYSFVIGVTSTDGGFSNYDPSGPVVFTNDEGFNYEISAPGLNIMSTLPFGNYGCYSGTSMSAPMVSGAVALLRSYDPQQSGEELLVKLIQGSNTGVLDIYNSLNPELVPSLLFVNNTFADTMPDCNNDGTIDAGETISFSITVRNSGGWADSVYSVMRLLNPSDTAYCSIQDSTAYIGDLSAFSTMNTLDLLLFHIDSLTPHAIKIPLEFEIGANNTSSIFYNDTIEIQNGEELSGILDSTLTITADKLWLVNQSFRIESNGELRVMPGTHLMLTTGILCYGKVIAIGTEDSLIYIEGPGSIRINEQYWSEFKHTYFYNSGFGMGRAIINDCTFDACYPSGILEIENTLIKNVYIGRIGWEGTIKRSNFINCTGTISRNDQGCLSHAFNNFSQISNQGGYMGSNYMNAPNNFLTESDQIICGTPRGIGVLQLPELFWGTTDSVKIANRITDFCDDPMLMMVDFQPILTQPTDSAHGCVWKVEINNVNPFDEYLAPLGTGSTKFRVFFNKPMDTSYTPLLSFSAWEPYNHHQVIDSAAWSNDSTKWTAYYEITEETGDGINIIKVSNARDTAGWLIPPEYNKRFKFVIQAASSASIDFVATGGLDQISLEWPSSSTPDAMGFNIYRYNMLNDSVSSDTIRLNASLLLDSCYTDYNVTADCTYYYLYTIVGTDLKENDYSKSVFANAYSTRSGDANGDLAIDVLDITTVVSYLLNQNPEPFIDYAADVNDDDEINVLDIVKLVNMVAGNGRRLTNSFIDQDGAYYCYHDHKLFLQSKGNVGGLQFEVTFNDQVTHKDGSITKPRIFALQNDFEFAYAQDGNKIKAILYSLSGKNIVAGEIPLLRFENIDTDGFEIKSVFGATIQGDYIKITECDKETLITDLISIPNPFDQSTKISFRLLNGSKVNLSIHDLNGRLIGYLIKDNLEAGTHNVGFSSSAHDGNPIWLPPGVYICRIHVTDQKNKQVITESIKLIKM